MSRNIRTNKNIISMPEKILSALAYFTCGAIGIILIVLSVLLKVNLKPFVKFNCYQAILLGFLFAFVQLTYGVISMILDFLQIIPFIGNLINSAFQFIIYYLMSFPVVFGFSLLATIIIGLILYLAIVTLMGKTPYIPYLSDAIKRVS